MSPPVRADARHLTRLRRDVVNDIIGTRRIAAYASIHEIELQIISCPPGDVVIRTGGIPAYADGANDLPVAVVERKAATEHVYAADATANHWVVLLAIAPGISAVSYVRVDRITLLQPVKIAAWLHGGIQVCRRKRQAVQAEVNSRCSLFGRKSRGCRATDRPGPLP